MGSLIKEETRLGALLVQVSVGNLLQESTDIVVCPSNRTLTHKTVKLFAYAVAGDSKDSRSMLDLVSSSFRMPIFSSQSDVHQKEVLERPIDRLPALLERIGEDPLAHSEGIDPKTIWSDRDQGGDGEKVLKSWQDLAANQERIIGAGDCLLFDRGSKLACGCIMLVISPTMPTNITTPTPAHIRAYKQAVRKILACAYSLRVSSLALPLFGTGKGHFSSTHASACLLEELGAFADAHPDSLLTLIRIVDLDFHLAFKQMEIEEGVSRAYQLVAKMEGETIWKCVFSPFFPFFPFFSSLPFLFYLFYLDLIFSILPQFFQRKIGDQWDESCFV